MQDLVILANPDLPQLIQGPEICDARSNLVLHLKTPFNPITGGLSGVR